MNALAQTDAEVETSRPTATRHTCATCGQPARTRWGRWRLDPQRDVLESRDDNGYLLFDIDLSDARRSSAACLDWIFQTSWMTNKDRADLLDAIQDVIVPQANLCSLGKERTLPEEWSFPVDSTHGPEETTVICPKCGSDRNLIFRWGTRLDSDGWSVLVIEFRGVCGHVFEWQFRQPGHKVVMTAEFVRNSE